MSDKLRIFAVMYEIECISVADFYQCALVTTSRMLTFPKFVIYFVSCFEIIEKKCLILYGKLCDVPIVEQYCLIRYLCIFHEILMKMSQF